jgi:iron complex transport system permease protein
VTTTRQFGSDIPHLPTDEPYGKRDVPRGPAPLYLRALAGLLDIGIVAIPLVLGWYIVDSLRDDNGGGQADRVVFGGAAVAIALGLAVWNRGFREGNTGRSSGKGWVGLVTRDTHTHDAVGPKRSLQRVFRRSGTEVVRESTASDEGFTVRE